VNKRPQLGEGPGRCSVLFRTDPIATVIPVRLPDKVSVSVESEDGVDLISELEDPTDAFDLDARAPREEASHACG
jgi:hypothetical protein